MATLSVKVYADEPGNIFPLSIATLSVYTGFIAVRSLDQFAHFASK